MINQRFWISPKLEVKQVSRTHINDVISNPEGFGLTKEEIDQEYAKHNEPLGLEGLARRDIIKHLLGEGWVRATYDQNHGLYLEPPPYTPNRPNGNATPVIAIGDLAGKTLTKIGTDA